MTARTATARDEMFARIQQALAEARAAGETAAEEYLRTAPKDAGGNLIPVNCGSAIVCVSGLKPRLRNALRTLGVISHGNRGTWVVEDMPGP